MKKYLLHTAKYGLLVFIFLNLISWISLYFLRNSSFYKPEFLTHEIKDKQFDYVIIGSSVGLTTLNTIQIDSITKKKGLNLSIDDTAISSNYLMIRHFFEQGKKTKYCIFSISYWDAEIKDPKLNNNDYRFLPFVSNQYVYNYYNNLEQGVFKPLTYSRYFPVIGVGYYNTEIFYPSLLSAIKPNKHNRFDDKGNYSYPDLGNLKDVELERKKVEMLNPYIQIIEELCKQYKTQLIIYQAPIHKKNIIYNTNKFQLINNSTVLKESLYFFDDIHVNSIGRKKASTIFANEFIENCLKNK